MDEKHRKPSRSESRPKKRPSREAQQRQQPDDRQYEKRHSHPLEEDPDVPVDRAGRPEGT